CDQYFCVPYYGPANFPLHFHAVHCKLTLFPTRRSSDLSGRFTIWCSRASWGCIRNLMIRGWLRSMRLPRRAGRALAGTSRAAARSEEHTSELQSLAYLVCRLLLEKKNNLI